MHIPLNMKLKKAICIHVTTEIHHKSIKVIHI